MNIIGLPDAENAVFHIKELNFHSGKKDFVSLLPGLIPSNYLPEKINLSATLDGKLTGFDGKFRISSTLGNIQGDIQKNDSGNYTALLNLKSVRLGELLNDTALGELNMSANISGNSFDISKGKTVFRTNVSSIKFNRYNYKDISIDGSYYENNINANISIKDSSLALDLMAKVNMNKNHESYLMDLDLKGANLKKLNLSTEDIRISLKATADLKGNSVNRLNGNAGITELIVLKDEKNYTVDSVLFASVNEDNKSSFNLKSSIASIKYEGTFAPGELGTVIQKHINRYFDLGDTTLKKTSPQNFSFEVIVNNHPLLSDVLLPGLNDFEQVSVKGSFNSEENLMNLEADIPRLVYGSTKIDSLNFKLNSDNEKLNYNLNLKEVSNPTINLNNTSLSGVMKDDEASINLLIKDSSSVPKLSLQSNLISLRENDYKIVFIPGGLAFNNEPWSIPEDNFIRFGKNGLLFNHFEITNGNQLMAVHTPAQRIDEEITLEFKKFQLETFSRLIEKDSSFVAGELNGTFQTKKNKTGSAFIADLKLNSVRLHEVPLGNISLNATNSDGGIYDASLSLSGGENDVNVKARYVVSENPVLDASIEIAALTMKTVSAFSNEQISNASGKITGSISVHGNPSIPEIKGNLRFEDAAFHSQFLNNYFTLKDEKLHLDETGLYFNSFTIRDSLGNTAILNGNIGLADLKVTRYNLSMILHDFNALNTTEKDNDLFFGKLILNSNTQVTGTQSLPEIYSKTKLKEGSYFTVIVPETKYSTGRGDGVVKFTDPKSKINPILTEETKKEITQSEIRGINLSADLEVDKNSTLKILVDPVSGDSLVLKGESNLSFGIDPSGKTSLTGTYTVSEGSYRVSLQELIRKDFKITSGSTISWNGDIMDADINIDAVHEQKTSPIDLVAGQIGGLSEQEKNTYKQALPFQVILHMKGALLKPEISFEIDLPPKYRGAMGGTVYAKLAQLNNNPSELNKQVFALLVLGRFIQEDPLASNGSGGGIGSVARTSVSKFLSQQLNRFSNQYIKGVELNFDLQSYDDYSTGTADQRTQVVIGLKKELFNDKLSVEVGSMVDLSNNKTQSNSNELASDVTLEYKISDDGAYRLKAFRQNQYSDVIEGPLNITGLGLVYTRDFDFWKDLFKKPVINESFIAPLKND